MAWTTRALFYKLHYVLFFPFLEHSSCIYVISKKIREGKSNTSRAFEKKQSKVDSLSQLTNDLIFFTSEKYKYTTQNGFFVVILIWNRRGKIFQSFMILHIASGIKFSGSRTWFGLKGQNRLSSRVLRTLVSTF